MGDMCEMAGKSAKNGITEGVIWKQILIFFFPILIGTFFQQLYNTVDAVVVGRFAGKEALSRSVGGSSSQIINFVVGFFGTFSRKYGYHRTVLWCKEPGRPASCIAHCVCLFSSVWNSRRNSRSFATPAILRIMKRRTI